MQNKRSSVFWILCLTAALIVCAAVGLFLYRQGTPFETAPMPDGPSCLAAASEPASDGSFAPDTSAPNDVSSSVVLPTMELAPSGELLPA